MSVSIIEGNLMDTKAKYICHQVNCQGKMGSGVAAQIREKFPKAYAEYNALCSSMKNKEVLLGEVQAVHCKRGADDVVICNLFGQLNYGYNGKMFTSYEAFQKCVDWLNRYVPDGETVAMPFRIGCGLGGADWHLISKMIERGLGVTHNVELWRWNPRAK